MWDIRYRPTRFAEVLGQEGTVQVLKARVANGSVLDTSYIFAGGPGQGKTTLARILARAALCKNVDKSTSEPCNTCEQCTSILDGIETAFEEKDAGSSGGIEVVREMLSHVPFTRPLDAPIRIWLFDEAHRLSQASQDALLKPIEEKKVICIFCTTEGRKIVGPVYRRCEEHPIHKVNRDQIMTRMKYVLGQEKVEYEEDAVLTIIDHAGGHVRDVLNRLETLSQTGPITLASVRESLNLSYVSVFYDILLSLGDPAKAVRLVEGLCEVMAPEDISAGIAESAMNAFRLANGMQADFTTVDRERAQQVHQRLGPATLKLAEFFLRSKYVTKISLTCDVVTVVQNNGVMPQEVVGQPLIIAIAAPFPASTAVLGSRLTSQDGPSVVQQAPTPPIDPAPANVQVPKSNGTTTTHPSEVDSPPLTTVDKNGIPVEYPRRSGQSTAGQIEFDRHTNEEGILSVPDWRREFETIWCKSLKARS